MREENDRLQEEVLVRFLTDGCTEAELKEVRDWAGRSAEHADELFTMEELHRLGRLDGMDEARIDLAERNLFGRIGQGKARRSRTRRMKTVLRYAALVAGICLLGVLGHYLVSAPLLEEEQLLVSTGDTVRTVVLPDGTRVWLNRHSSLRYPRSFASDRRDVYLEGEGYFEVGRDPARPFTVQSPTMRVRVLGTVFNLRTDRMRKSATATLVKGEIQVKGNRNEGMVVLAPGQRAELDGVAGRLTVKQVEAAVEDWHDRTFVFVNADVYAIARMLESSFGVKVILAPGLDTKKTYSGTLKRKERVEDMLESIANVVPFSYKAVGGSVFLSVSPQK